MYYASKEMARSQKLTLMGNSLLEILGIFFIIGLSFVFHMVVYEDDWVKEWYWKVLIGGGILTVGMLAILGY